MGGVNIAEYYRGCKTWTNIPPVEEGLYLRNNPPISAVVIEWVVRHPKKGCALVRTTEVVDCDR